MPMPVNRFKQGLRQGPPLIGLWLALADPYCAEVCASAGLDWLLLDAEHGPNDLRSLLAQLQALAPYPVQPVVRPPVGDTVLIKQLLDIGAQTLLIPLVETLEQARALVQATRYPPAGVRGIGGSLTRATRWGGLADYLDRADEEVCLLVQVETRRGLASLPAIAQLDGVDGVFIGPNDLAASLGHRGDPQHPQVRNAIAEGIAAIRAAGKAAGCLSSDEVIAQGYLDQGCRFVAVGADVTLLARSAQALARRFKPAGSS